MHYIVWAIDPPGGQAIIRHGMRWYLVSIDTGWKHVEFKDEKNALAWVLSNSAISSDLDFHSMEEAISEIRRVCLSQLDIPNTSFSDVSHLCPISDGDNEKTKFSSELSPDLPPSQWPVTALLQRCSKRPLDEAAWQEFVRRYNATIKAHVTKTFHKKAREESDRKPQFPDDLIEDLVQAVYMRLIEDKNRALKRFEADYENSIYQYLGTISINVVRDYFREVRAQKRPKIAYSLDELLGLTKDEEIIKSTANRIDGPPASSSSLTLDDVDRALEKAVVGKGRERDQQKLMFKLRYYDGLPLNSIIKILGLNTSKSIVNTILTRVSRKVKERLSV